LCSDPVDTVSDTAIAPLLPRCLATVATNNWRAENAGRLHVLLFTSVAPCGAGCHPYHVKCLDATSTVPIYGIRFSFVSQLGSSEIDPAYEQMSPYTNISACLRMLFLHFLSISFLTMNSDYEVTSKLLMHRVCAKILLIKFL